MRNTQIKEARLNTEQALFNLEQMKREVIYRRKRKETMQERDPSLQLSLSRLIEETERLVKNIKDVEEVYCK